MIFQSDVQLIELDLTGYIDELNSRMQDTIRDAARSWLTVVLAIIPTWSRASRATFNELAEAVNFNLTFDNVPSAPDRLLLGLRTGRGGIETDNRTFWKFFYETDLRYLAFNEFNRAVVGQNGVFAGLKRPGPYRFQRAGAQDFENFSKGIRATDPTFFIRGRRI